MTKSKPRSGSSQLRKTKGVAPKPTRCAALPADQLLALLLALIHGGAETHVAPGDDLAVRREALVAGVRLLTSPT